MSAKVLVIDDDEDNRLLIRNNLLKSFKIEVVEAHCGSDAIEKLHLPGICLVVCDFMMPGANGLEVYDHYKGHPEIIAKFIMYTASPDKVRHQRPGLIVVEKPKIDELVKKVSELGVLAR